MKWKLGTRLTKAIVCIQQDKHEFQELLWFVLHFGKRFDRTIIWGRFPIVKVYPLDSSYS